MLSVEDPVKVTLDLVARATGDKRETCRGPRLLPEASSARAALCVCHELRARRAGFPQGDQGRSLVSRRRLRPLRIIRTFRVAICTRRVASLAAGG